VVQTIIPLGYKVFHTTAPIAWYKKNNLQRFGKSAYTADILPFLGCIKNIHSQFI
jgi:hypothetical protein